MVDKEFCMSSYLAFRYVEKEKTDFFPDVSYSKLNYNQNLAKILVYTVDDIDREIEKQICEFKLKYKKVGLFLSGGMDSAIIASYLKGNDAYTFRFLGGKYQEEELKRAELYAQYYDLNLHYVDISWDTVANNLEKVMRTKGGPVHSIEPQLYQGAIEAKQDGIDAMIIGNGSDYVFGGMDKLLQKDWGYNEFIERYIYTNPFDVLENPVSVEYLFERYRTGEKIDFLRFMNDVAIEESYSSYANAFNTAGMCYLDPYAKLKMGDKLDLKRIRRGESKYLIRELFKMKYPEMEIPEKIPMPRPVDIYFKDWSGPTRKEFKQNLDINTFNGNQKWQMYCLEQFLNMYENKVQG